MKIVRNNKAEITPYEASLSIFCIFSTTLVEKRCTKFESGAFIKANLGFFGFAHAIVSVMVLVVFCVGERVRGAGNGGSRGAEPPWWGCLGGQRPLR